MNVDWFITNICDQARFCRFCYAPWNAFPSDVPIQRALDLCSRLISLKVHTVTICGGEPQLYPELGVVLHRLSSAGIKTILYTNAIPVREDFTQLLTDISILSLPVDAVTDGVVDRMRGRHQFERVQHVLTQLDGDQTSPAVKVGTVVTRQNIGDLEAVGKFLATHGSVAIWRLYQFSPYGIGRTHQRELLLSDGEFDEAMNALTQISWPFRLSVRSRSDNTGYCLIMDSHGSFYRYEEAYIPLGVSIFETRDAILEHYDLEKNGRQKSWAA